MTSRPPPLGRSSATDTQARSNITGPAVVCGPERAAIASEILGRSISYAVVTKDQLRANLQMAKLPDAIIDVFCEIKTAFVEGKFDIVTGQVERLSGRSPKSLRDILARTLM
jgi:NAD(P)H dehydrogenase (quinone)